MIALAVSVLRQHGRTVSKDMQKGLQSRGPMVLLKWFYHRLPSTQEMFRQARVKERGLEWQPRLTEACEDMFVDQLMDQVKPSFTTFSALGGEFGKLYYRHTIALKCTVYGAWWYKFRGWTYQPESDDIYDWEQKCKVPVWVWMSMAINRELLKVSSDQMGRGGSAVVVKGYYRDKPVAIKKLHRTSARDLFFGLNNTQNQQVRADITKWRHQNVVRTFGMCFDPCCVVMELLPYSATVVNNYQQSRQQKLATILYAARGLQYLHCDQKYAHCDMKLANLLITDAGIVKIADLNNASKLDMAMIYPVGRVYTPTHVAPELLLQRITRQMMGPVDIFAFGITMLEVMQAPATLPKRTASSLALPGINPSLFEGIEPIQELIKRCLSDNPAERPRIEEIVQVMERLCPDNISVLPSSLLRPDPHSGPVTQETNTGCTNL
eukprot:TRINITY_DN1020_c0_g1_i1.p1 TRINITY_DN1020_c0_g1~~TRINITY_DN1020_c0_g1_i1.p1  ORF type:complete len:486 (-),score=54.00 TRINITY_DN1020_c0_g1_i1:364-1674(-)